MRTKLTASLCFLFLGFGVARAQEVKVGYVDVRRALYETEDGVKARTSLKRVFDQKQKELDEQQDEVKTAIEDLNKKRTLLPADSVRQKEAELQERVAKIQQTYQRYQQDMAAKEAEATQPIIERLQRIVAKIAAAENFTMILDKNQGVVFAKPASRSDQRSYPALQLGRGEGSCAHVRRRQGRAHPKEVAEASHTSGRSMRRVMMSDAVGEGNPGETWIETHSGRHYRFFACLPPPSSTWTWMRSSRRWSSAILPSCAASPLSWAATHGVGSCWRPRMR